MAAASVPLVASVISSQHRLPLEFLTSLLACTEHLVAERQPLASPFAGEEHQCRDPAGDMPSMPHAEPASKRSKHVSACSQLLPLGASMTIPCC